MADTEKTDEANQGISWDDTPLEKLTDDELDRAPFAHLIAQALMADTGPRAKVIAVTGGWGSGKTTVANFALRKIEEQDNRGKDERLTVIRFEPWMVGTPEALVREFFIELGKAIFPNQDTEDSQKKRAQYYKYAALALDALAATAEVGSVLGVPFTGIVSKGFGAGKKAFENAAKGLEMRAILPSLREAKENLCKSLLDLKKPVIVVIDDIDRLNSSEIRTVFQLIKACADFPNVRYLLLYDREQVIHALKDTVMNPEAFLEKIVNRPFDLPLATEAQKTEFLRESLEPLNIPALKHNASVRLDLVISGVLLAGLPTLRQVKRFCGTVALLLPQVISGEHVNVDPADFLALEFLRQVVPELYSVIKEEKSPAPGGFINQLTEQGNSASDQIEKRERATPAAEPLKSCACLALRVLKNDLPNRLKFGPEDLHAECRFASDQHVNTYLGFDASRAILSSQLWEEIRRDLNAPVHRPTWLELFITRPDTDLFADGFARRVGTLSYNEAIELLTIMAPWAENRPPNERHPTNVFAPGSAVEKVGTACLKRISGDPNADATGVASQVLKETGSLGFIGCICAVEHIALGNSENRGKWTTGEHFRGLAYELVLSLTNYINSSNFFEHTSPDEVLMAYKVLAGESAYKEWLGDVKKDNLRLIQYAGTVMSNKYVKGSFSVWDEESDPSFCEALKTINLNVLPAGGQAAVKHCLETSRERNPAVPRTEWGNESGP